MDPTVLETARIREIAVSRWWNGADLSAPLRTCDGRDVSIVFRGQWSHGLGPDFQRAMIDFGDGRLLTGSIEIHLSTSGWRQHGHDRDPRYNDTILHLVLRHDDSETRRSDGRMVPVAAVCPDPTLLAAIDERDVDWSLVGGTVCAEQIAQDEPATVCAALGWLGDQRLSEKVAQISARFEQETPADILFELMMDGLGYSANREPMRQLAQRLPISLVDALLATVEPHQRFELGLGLLLGTGGFLPMSPGEAEIAHLDPATLERVERYWQSHGSAWHQERIAPTAWARTRVRPANHPLVRLRMAAALLTTSFEGITVTVIETVRSDGDPVRLLMERSQPDDRPGMGEGRAIAIVANAVIPFLLALADVTNDAELAEMASRKWEALSASEPNQITRRAMRQVAGSTRIARVGERELQGLIQLDRRFCEPRRCMECAIAHLVVSWQTAPVQAAIE